MSDILSQFPYLTQHKNDSILYIYFFTVAPRNETYIYNVTNNDKFIWVTQRKVGATLHRNFDKVRNKQSSLLKLLELMERQSFKNGENYM